MTTEHGFTLIETREIPELNTRASLYRHENTGAELLSLENDDENKVFGITFRTPPPDSTGLPHIMEHSVLCGSRKYPVKEPFVELVKGSLNTFLNAMTFSDKTCYPVASQNLQDFYNLVDVYLDAVFFPRLTPEILEQEGWHYEFDEDAAGGLDAPLTYKGVVFNEMKGAYASPDSLIGRYSEQSLFPDNVYGRDSGGDPEVIPDLTYAQFKRFHEVYYHPSNARIFFYGDDDPEARLRMVSQYLDDKAGQELKSPGADSHIALQSRLSEPRRIVKPYPAGEASEGGNGESKSMITVNWLLPENSDPKETLALNILSHILIETPASPLRKALIDSGLGEEVIGGGLDDSLRQLYFSAGMKGVDPDKVDQVESLIFDTLQELAATGLDPDMIAASVNTVEFRLREQNTGRYPRGLLAMIWSLSTWLHDGDPFAPLAFEQPLQAIKAAVSEDPRTFEALIAQHLLDNNHRATVILEPDPALQDRQEATEKARLAAAKEKMAEADLRELAAHVRRFKKQQEAPDSPEALATIPSLGLEDLDPEPKHVPTEVLSHHDTQVLYHDLFTNGIVYLDLGFNLHRLPQELLPYTALFMSGLLELGTESEDFVKLTQRIGRETGGIGPTTFTSAMHRGEGTAAWAVLRGKSTVEQSGELLAILRDILLTARLDNQGRFQQMVLERKAREESGLVPAGHRVVASRLRARFSEAHWVSEQIDGLDYLFFLRRLAEELASDWPGVLEKLETIRRLLVRRDAMVCNVTLDAENWTKVEPQVADFLGQLPGGEGAGPSALWTPAIGGGPEALTIPANVNYVGKGADLFSLGYRRHGSAEVISHYVRSTWLWERVRVQGGAYGGFCLFDSHSGAFAYVSYRDPNVAQTLTTYDQTSTFLRNLELSQEELVKSIIGAIGNVDAYQLPDAKGYSAMVRYLIDYPDEARQQYRTELLNTTVEDFKAFGDLAQRVAESGTIVVLGSPAAIQQAAAEKNLEFSVTKVM